jgi:hypothetical protein
MNLSQLGQQAKINGDIITIGTSEDQSLIIDCLDALNPNRFSWVGSSVVNSDILEFRDATNYNRWRIKTEFENATERSTGAKILVFDQSHFWEIGSTTTLPLPIALDVEVQSLAGEILYYASTTSTI